MRGMRIQNIVNELNGEKIDVVEWNEDPARYVANALSPAQVSRRQIDEDTRRRRRSSCRSGSSRWRSAKKARMPGWPPS